MRLLLIQEKSKSKYYGMGYVPNPTHVKKYLEELGIDFKLCGLYHSVQYTDEFGNPRVSDVGVYIEVSEDDSYVIHLTFDGVVQIF